MAPHSSLGCLFELTKAGKVRERDTFLEDGGEILMTAKAAEGAIYLGALSVKLEAAENSESAIRAQVYLMQNT